MADLIEEGRLRTWLEGRGWELRDGGLERDRSFADFSAAVSFVTAVAGLAEAQGHHPDIALHDLNQVRLRLVTHSAGGVTVNDTELAERVDELQ